MPILDDNSESLNQATLYGMGSLEGVALDDVERLLAAGDPTVTAEVESLQLVVEQMALAAPCTSIRPRVKERLMAGVRHAKLPGFDEPEQGVHVLRAGNGNWRETGYPGVTTKILHIEKETRMATTFLRLIAGARYPPHRHSMLEQCLVISGDVRLGDKIHIFAGDYEKALPGTGHDYLSSDTGCELLIISCLEDEIMTR